MEFRIADTFTASLARLTADERTALLALRTTGQTREGLYD